MYDPKYLLPKSQPDFRSKLDKWPMGTLRRFASRERRGGENTSSRAALPCRRALLAENCTGVNLRALHGAVFLIV